MSETVYGALRNVTASLETVMTHCGANMSEGDRRGREAVIRGAHSALEYVRRLQKDALRGDETWKKLKSGGWVKSQAGQAIGFTITFSDDETVVVATVTIKGRVKAVSKETWFSGKGVEEKAKWWLDSGQWMKSEWGEWYDE